MASLNDYLFVSGLLFVILLAGVIVRQNIIVIFMCLELMLASASLTLVAFSRFHLFFCSIFYEMLLHVINYIWI